MNSPSYLKKIRLLTNLTKTLRSLAYVPNAPARPAKDPKKQEAHDKTWASRPTKADVRYWLTSPEFDDSRRYR